MAETSMSGKLTAEQVRDAIFKGSTYANYDGAQYYASGIGMQAIADELSAAIGAGECEMDVLDTGNEAAYEHYEYIMHCANCHHEFGYVQYNEDGDTWQDEKPAFCPKCGKAVKR